MRAIPIGRKIILLGTVIMAVVLAVVLAIFWSRDRGLSRAEYRAEYQNNVAILEAADGRRFLGYFVAADKLVCINTYCANDKELDTSRYECSDPIRLDSIRVIYPQIAITDILFPTNYQYIHRFIVFKTTPYDGYVNPAMSGPLVEGVVREDFVLYEINGSKPNAVEIIPVHYNPGSSGGLAPYRWPHCKDENGNDTTVCIQPGFLVAKSYG